MLGNIAILPNGINGIMLADISDPSDVKNIQALDMLGNPCGPEELDNSIHADADGDKYE